MKYVSNLFQQDLCRYRNSRITIYNYDVSSSLSHRRGLSGEVSKIME
jgi:hypothetical protein